MKDWLSESVNRHKGWWMGAMFVSYFVAGLLLRDVPGYVVAVLFPVSLYLWFLFLFWAEDGCREWRWWR